MEVSVTEREVTLTCLMSRIKPEAENMFFTVDAPSVPDKDYLLCTSWHFLVKKPL